MRKFATRRRRWLVAVFAGVIAPVSLFAATALASVAPAGCHRYEVFSGSVRGTGYVVPITARGVVYAPDGTLNLNTTGANSVLEFPSGDVYVTHEQTSQSQKFNRWDCVASYSEEGRYQVDSGTGVFTGARGSGHYTIVSLVRYMHRRHGHGCNTNAPPVGGATFFHAWGPFSIWQT